MGWGAVSGALDAWGQQLEREAAAEEQRRLIELQHQREMERIRLQHQLQMHAEQERRRAAAASAAASTAEVERQMEAAHPGWKSLVNTKAFGQWMTQQPASVRRLASSHAPADAILMIDLFKRDTPSWANTR